MACTIVCDVPFGRLQKVAQLSFLVMKATDNDTTHIALVIFDSTISLGAVCNFDEPVARPYAMPPLLQLCHHSFLSIIVHQQLSKSTFVHRMYFRLRPIADLRRAGPADVSQ